MTENENLIVTSKVKKYIKEKGDMNFSAKAAEALSECVAYHCDKAIEKAKKDRRKTVMDRDFCCKSCEEECK
ncbi:MAG: hypothetical protein ACQEP8_04625 [Chlamydiota bacterium]